MTIYTYFPNIPNPPDAPADDVASMQTNSASIAGIIGVDHVGFGSSGNGQHKQVTFNANNVPAVFPTPQPVLFTNLPSAYPPGTGPGYPELFFYSGSVAQSSNQYYYGSNNGTQLSEWSGLQLGGFIIKCGTFTILNGNGSRIVNFVNAFPNACLAVNITCTVAIVANDNIVTVNAIGATTFTANRQAFPFGAQATYNYIAIGN